MIAALWNFVVGDSRTPDERRAEILNSIVRHGTPSTDRVNTVVSPGAAMNDYFVLPALIDKWDLTSGDFPNAGKSQLISQADIAMWVNENVITDGTVIKYARDHTDEDGLTTPDFYDAFADTDFVLVYIHASHFKGRISLSVDGKVYLNEPLNKTRDPYALFDPMCQIARPTPPQTQREYAILTPLPTVLQTAYNKEARRLGKEPIN
jgi:hypothetical protein